MAVEDSVDKSLRATCGEIKFLHQLVVGLYIARALLHAVTIENFSTVVGEANPKMFPFFNPRQLITA